MKNKEIENLNASLPSEGESSTSESELEREDRARFIVRLRSLIPARGENAFARRAGISPSGLRGALKNGNPGRAMMIAIAREAGVNVAWLATGEGPRERRQGGEAKGEPIASGRWPAPPCHNQEEDEGAGAVDVAVFFSIVEAAQALEGDLSKEDRVEIGMRMMRAIAVVSDHDEQRLDQEDFHALARIVRKLVGVSQT